MEIMINKGKINWLKNIYTVEGYIDQVPVRINSDYESYRIIKQQAQLTQPTPLLNAAPARPREMPRFVYSVSEAK